MTVDFLRKVCYNQVNHVYRGDQMDLGEKIRQARLDAGLSQRQLCGEEITRNMLSLIEHGTARPSMKTLRMFAQRLGKPISYFLEEGAEDPTVLTQSAEALRQGTEALAEGKSIYAAQLLEQVMSPLLFREKLLLSARIPGANLTQICRELPSLDEELRIRAESALIREDLSRCRSLLEACEDREAPKWLLLMGKLHMAQSHWAEAAACLEAVEAAFSDAVPLLEVCFRELGDFQRAYEYACRQKM